VGEKDHSQRAFEVADGRLSHVPLGAIRGVRARLADDPMRAAAALADLCRINVLYMIMQAGSGHIGSSFSSIDIVTWLWTNELRAPNTFDRPDADVYFSSKGHDAPALYAVLLALEKLDFDLVHTLRRLGGLPGHPDVATPYIAANTGSLGMGISKALGMALANRYRGRSGRIYVMTGDGELQEGQIWESLQPAVSARAGEITVIVDHNKLQSDAAVAAVSDLGAIEDKFRAFGWEVARCDGHDFAAVRDALSRLRHAGDRPQVLIADTIKGKGVSFMEGLACGDQTYHFHAGAPSLRDYAAATREIVERVNATLARAGEAPIELVTTPLPARVAPARPERLVVAYGEELLSRARERDDIVVLDADLLSDCGIEAFKAELPDRFIECGIAEQHMVSVAGGLALRGMLPIVHSFACFLSTRANEQIYTNATERRRIIYTGTLAGLVPGGPGHSHQSVRDISALGSVPGLVLIEPSSEREARLAIRWAIDANPESTYLRFVNVPLDLPYRLPDAYELRVGRGVVLRDGDDAVIAAYGPVMLRAAWEAADLLLTRGLRVAVVNVPWLNRIDRDWAADALASYPLVVTLDNHYTALGQGTQIAAALASSDAARPAVLSLGVADVPACGSNAEVLAYHRLDSDSIAAAIERRLVPSGAMR
jgi:transketolase